MMLRRGGNELIDGGSNMDWIITNVSGVESAVRSCLNRWYRPSIAPQEVMRTSPVMSDNTKCSRPNIIDLQNHAAGSTPGGSERWALDSRQRWGSNLLFRMRRSCVSLVKGAS